MVPTSSGYYNPRTFDDGYFYYTPPNGYAGNESYGGYPSRELGSVGNLYGEDSPNIEFWMQEAPGMPQPQMFGRRAQQHSNWNNPFEGYGSTPAYSQRGYDDYSVSRYEDSYDDLEEPIELPKKPTITFDKDEFFKALAQLAKK